MKTVLSNTKRFLAVFLALAMVVLAVPNAPTDLLAAEVDPEVEAVETTEAEVPAVEDEGTPAVEEEPVEAAEAVGSEDPADASAEEEPVADDAAVGDDAEEEAVLDESALGTTTLEDMMIVADTDDSQNSAILVASGNATSNLSVIYIAKGSTGTAILSQIEDVTPNVVAVNTDRDDAQMPWSGTASWRSSDTTIVPNPVGSERKVTIEGKKAGVSYITASYTIKDTDAASGKTDTFIHNTLHKNGTKVTDADWATTAMDGWVVPGALKVVVVDMGVVDDPASTNGHREDDGSYTLDLDTINASNESDTMQDKLAEKVTYFLTGDTAEMTGTFTTGKVTKNVSDRDPIDGPYTVGTRASVTANAGGGSAVILGAPTIANTVGGKTVTLNANVSVVNNTVQITAKRGTKKVSDNGEGFTAGTGSEWAAFNTADMQEIEAGEENAVTYQMSVADELGNEVTGVKYYTNIDRIDGYTGKILVNMNENTGEMKVQGVVAGDYNFVIFAKKAINDNSLVVGRTTAHIRVNDDASFRFSNKDDTTKAVTSNFAFLSKASGNGDGESATGNEVELWTPTANTTDRVWAPSNSKIIDAVTSLSGNENPSANIKANANAKTENFGTETVKVSLKGKEQYNDSFTITRLGVFRDGKELDVNGLRIYTTTLGISQVEGVTENVPASSYYGSEKEPRALATGDYNVYRNGSTSASNNVGYQEVGKLLVVGVPENSVTFSPATITALNGGLYYTSKKPITAPGGSAGMLYDLKVAEVSTDGTITAYAPGTVTTTATYTGKDDKGNTIKWSMPIEITVSALSDDSIDVTANGDSFTVFADGNASIVPTTRVSDNQNVLSTGVTYSYAISNVTGDDVNAGNKDSYMALALLSVTDNDKQGTGTVFTINDPTGLITKPVHYTVSLTGDAKEAMHSLTPIQDSCTVTVNVIPVAQGKIKLADGQKDRVYTSVLAGQERTFVNESGVELEVTSADESVAKAAPKDGSKTTVVEITPKAPGKTNVSVKAKGSSEAPVVIPVEVFAISGVGVTANKDTGEFDVYLGKVGEIYTSSELTLFSADAKSNATWRKTGTGAGSVTMDPTTGSPVVTATKSDAAGTKLLVSYKDGTDYNNIDFVTGNVKFNTVTVNVKPDAATKTITAATKVGDKNFFIVPDVVFTNEATGKEVEGREYTLEAVYALNADKDHVTFEPTTVDGKPALKVVPKSGLGTWTVSVKAVDKQTGKDLATSATSVKVSVQAPAVFKGDSSKGVTDNTSYTTVTNMTAFTNYAVTEVNSKGQATKIETDPKKVTLSMATLYSNDGVDHAFNTGWSFGDNDGMLVKNLPDTYLVDAVYQINGVAIATVPITINPFTFKGIALEEQPPVLTKVTDEYYEAKWSLKSEIDVTATSNIWNEAAQADATTAEPFNLIDKYAALTAEVISGAPYVGVENVKTDGFRLNSGTSVGEGIVVIEKAGDALTIGTSAANNISEGFYVYSGSNVTGNQDEYPVLTGGATWLNNGKYFIKAGSSATLTIAVSGNDASENMTKDSSNNPVIYVESSDPEVANVITPVSGKMTWGGPVTGAIGYTSYSATIMPGKVGKSTVTLTATDGVATTMRVEVFVVDSGITDVSVDAIKLSNYAEGANAQAEAVFNVPTNETFSSFDGSKPGEDDGYVPTLTGIVGNDSQYFSLVTGTNKIKLSQKNVPAKDYNVMLTGELQLKYYDHTGASHTSDATDKIAFNSIPITITVTNDQFIAVAVDEQTLSQGDSVTVEPVIKSVGWDATAIEFKPGDDADAAAEAGLSFSGLTLKATSDAEITESETYTVIVSAKETYGEGTATGEADMIVHVKKSEDPKVQIGALGDVKQGKTAQMTATWSKEGVTGTKYALSEASAGISLSESGVLTVANDAELGARTLYVDVTGKYEGRDIKASTTVAVKIVEKDPVDVNVTMSDVSIPEGSSKALTATATNGFKATGFAFADATTAATVGLSITDGTLHAAYDAENPSKYVGTTNQVINVTVANASTGESTVVPVTIAITVTEKAGGDHDVDTNPTPENELEDITNETFKAYQVESSFDLTDKAATTTVYFVGNVDPDEVTLPSSSAFEINSTIVDSGYTKVILELKDKTWSGAQAAAKNGKKLEFTLSKGGVTALKPAKLTLKASATTPKVNLTVKSGTAYSAGESYWGQWFTNDKNGNLNSEGATVVYVADKNSTTAVEDVNVTGGTLIDYEGTNEYKNGGLYVTNENWVDGLGVFAAFKITKAKATAQPTIKLGKKSATLKNVAGQVFKTPVTVGGMTIGDADYDVTGAPENVNAVVEGGQLAISTEEGVAAGTYTLTVNTKSDVAIQAKKAETFKLTVTDKEAKVSYSVKGKLDAIADDTAVFVTPKLTNASAEEIEVTPETQTELNKIGLMATVVDGIIYITKDPSAFGGNAVQYIEKGNKTINSFTIVAGGATVSAKLNIPVVQGKLTATGTAIDFRNKVGVEYGTSSIQAVYTYSVYNAAGKVAMKKYYTFTNEAVKLSDQKVGKLTSSITEDGQVKVNCPNDGKDYNGSVKVTVNGTNIKPVTAKFKVFGKNK